MHSDDAAAGIVSMPPGTRVTHRQHPEYGLGTVLNEPISYGQMTVYFDNRRPGNVACYPMALELAE